MLKLLHNYLIDGLFKVGLFKMKIQIRFIHFTWLLALLYLFHSISFSFSFYPTYSLNKPCYLFPVLFHILASPTVSPMVLFDIVFGPLPFLEISS